MKGKMRFLMVFCLVFFNANFVFAQFPSNMKEGLKKRESGESNISVSALKSSKDNVVGIYLESTKELVKSLEKAAEAFDVKKEVLKKLAVVKSLKEGNINNQDLNKARKASKEAQAIIKKKMAETKVPSAKSKKLIAESIVHLVSGIQKEKELIGMVKDLSSKAQTATTNVSATKVMEVKKVASTAATLVKAVPMDLELTKDILSYYLQYAKANNITVPGNATDLLE